VLALAMTMHKPSGPRYRRASERSRNAASMLLFLGTRVRRVVGDMVTQSGHVYKPPCERSTRPRGSLAEISTAWYCECSRRAHYHATEQANATVSALRPAQV
jgi:hypothetical protein